MGLGNNDPISEEASSTVTVRIHCSGTVTKMIRGYQNGRLDSASPDGPIPERNQRSPNHPGAFECPEFVSGTKRMGIGEIVNCTGIHICKHIILTPGLS